MYDLHYSCPLVFKYSTEKISKKVKKVYKNIYEINKYFEEKNMKKKNELKV